MEVASISAVWLLPTYAVAVAASAVRVASSLSCFLLRMQYQVIKPNSPRSAIPPTTPPIMGPSGVEPFLDIPEGIDD